MERSAKGLGLGPGLEAGIDGFGTEGGGAVVEV